ncbi:hypothetical protein [Pseudoduganella aquatica]|uniref:Uncharacterized protein n=1 Tax=Pseudoduganella aquatica TaxID=2660641 RepID=A0A7X4HHC6_9BURK|nr:hypothetical protein [Pseudoduganella aquatica]MYN11234.1 hypothetical protein [Pseudoduganella aquatica]
MKQTKMYRKVKPFCVNRLFPVATLWLFAVAIYWSASWVVGFLSEGGGATRLNLVSLAAFGDGRVVLILSLCALAAMSVLSLIELNVNARSINRANMERFPRQLWDEVSSASAHAGAALIASVYWSGGEGVSRTVEQGRMLTAVALLGIAFLSYHLDETGQRGEAAGENKHPPNRV